jgi:hypothetical protein
MKRMRARAEDAAEERVLDALLPPPRGSNFFGNENAPAEDNATRQKFRKKLREGELDDKEIEVELAAPAMSAEIFAPPGMEELTSQIQGMFQNMGSGRKKSRKLKIREATKLLIDEEAAKLVNDEEVKLDAVQNVEQNGIVFLDEIDKIASRSDAHGADVSRQGVQRDLLPLVEGTTVSTKYGMIKTDHILFIASGAFHLSKPSDLIPELQGRFPIRVELESLSVTDFEHILTGGGFNYMGELIPYWFRLSTMHRHLHNQELAGEMSVMSILGTTRYVIRTMLHYPQVWNCALDCIQQGIRIGRESEPFWMARMEDVWHLPLEEARRTLGIRGAVDLDTQREGDIWGEVARG